MDMMAPGRGGAAGASASPPPDATMPQRAAGAIPPGAEIPSHYRLCIGCGEDHPSGLHLQAQAGPGLTLIGQYTVGEQHQGAPGLAHGGVLMAVLDEVMGALNWLLMTPAVTARLEVDMLRPVPVGTVVHVRAWITGQSGRKVYSCAEGRLADPAGPVAVRAEGLFISVPEDHFTRHGNPAQVSAAEQDRAGEPRRPWLEISP